MVPTPPVLRAFALMFNPAPMFAVAVPVGAMLSVPATEIPLVIVFEPEPESVKFAYAATSGVCAPPL